MSTVRQERECGARSIQRSPQQVSSSTSLIIAFAPCLLVLVLSGTTLYRYLGYHGARWALVGERGLVAVQILQVTRPAASQGWQWRAIASHPLGGFLPYIERSSGIGAQMGIPAWILVAVSAVPCILVYRRRRRGRDRGGGEPRCGVCDYCLGGLEHHVCPECGTPVPALASDGAPARHMTTRKARLSVAHNEEGKGADSQ